MFRLLLNPLQLRIPHAHTRISAATAPSITNSDEDEYWRGYTISPLLIGGVSPKVFFSFLLEKTAGVPHGKPKHATCTAPRFCVGAKGKEENLRFRKAQRKTCSEHLLERVHEEGLVEPGASLGQPWGAEESSSKPPSNRSALALFSPCPTPTHPSGATRDAQGRRR